ncbi:MAG: response regulator [Chitinivibrionia bacterium]|nr:response regulator [Chitinivibrionia bacterium]
MRKMNWGNWPEMAEQLGTKEIERTTAQESLQVMAARLLRAEKVSRSGNWELDLRRMTISGSEEAARIYGLADIEWPLDLIKKIPLPEYREMLDSSLRKLIEGVGTYDVEFKIRRPDTGAVVDIRSVAEYDQQEQRVFGILQDITERKEAEEEKRKLEAQLLQSRKMEAIGQLAGGVAHDFNNILTVISGFGYLLQAEMAKEDPRKSHVDQILLSAGRAANLTRDLLAFSRRQEINLEAHNVNGIVTESVRLLERLVTEDVELKILLSDVPMVVMADVTQIGQVLMNLAANARDAMPRGGTLTIETKIVSLDEEFIKSHGYGQIGEYAVISVSDSGSGMDAFTVEHIFEPFFTTKEVGKGTGLGLSMVYGIVKQHNGYITVRSDLGSGTSIDVYLPLVESGTRENSLPAEEIRGGTETILIAEDDPGVMKLTTEVLSKSAYTIIEAHDGDEAIRAFAAEGPDVDLVILDVVMPKKNGREVYEAIKEKRPEMKIIFMSGYTGDVILDKGIEDETVEIIRKPASPLVLLRKVREVLERGPA